MIRRSRVPVRIPTDPAVLGYVAGLIDGEGNLTISKSLDRKKGRSVSHTPTLQIGNTDPRMAAWLHEQLGGSVDHPDTPTSRPAGPSRTGSPSTAGACTGPTSTSSSWPSCRTW